MTAAQRPHPWRRRALLAGWIVAASIIVARAAQIQVVQASTWASLAEEQHRGDEPIPASRGTIMDRDGTPLSVSRERVRISLAPHELHDREATAALLVEELGLSTRRAAEYAMSTGQWRQLPDLYPPSVRDGLSGRAGIYVETVMQRFHPHGDLARGVLGVVLDEQGAGGIEAAYDDLLRGTPGREVVPHDPSGNVLPGARVVADAPQPGGQVVLTLNMDLQEIAQQTLVDAIDEHSAQGGDIIISNPKSGELLALFSIRNGNPTAMSVINTPYEPGSTIKPITVAGLMRHELASLDDMVDTEDGTWFDGFRTVSDISRDGGVMTIREALQQSSNAGIAKASSVMSPGQHFETLRDFGFGSLTGMGLTGEVSGTLRRPSDWSGTSASALSIGYEVSVTALQMAMAYGAFANGGLLMQPMLVSELRNPDGTVRERFDPVVVRRVVDHEVAVEISDALVGVVELGTGSSARMGNFPVAGKSGTARFADEDGYESGAYSSSFVSYFPADEPQLVIFVKLHRPADDYYGGAVAAPVSRATMEAALAASATPLDLGALVTSVRNEPVEDLREVAAASFAALPIAPPAPPMNESILSDGGFAVDGVSLPDVSGLPARVAARRLHALGLRVARIGVGDVAASYPAPGARVEPGDTIRLRYSGRTYE